MALRDWLRRRRGTGTTAAADGKEADTSDGVGSASTGNETSVGDAGLSGDKRSAAGIVVLIVLVLGGNVAAYVSSPILSGIFAGGEAERQTFRRSIDKMVIDLGPAARAKNMRTGFVFEVVAPGKEAADRAVDRYRNALQMYLRSLDEADLEERAAVRHIMQHGRRRLAVASPDSVELEEFLVTDLVVK